MDACQVSVAVPGEDEAKRISESVLEARLAACVQVIGPVHSRYWWQGEIQTSLEWLCLIKTRQSLMDELVTAIHELHSYDTPEILTVPITGGDPAYLSWMERETSR
jgi:periplasmic divalent cation tolerance protein